MPGDQSHNSYRKNLTTDRGSEFISKTLLSPLIDWGVPGLMLNTLLTEPLNQTSPSSREKYPSGNPKES